LEDIVLGTQPENAGKAVMDLGECIAVIEEAEQNKLMLKVIRNRREGETHNGSYKAFNKNPTSYAESGK
jgi:hypothetical protein